MRGGERCVVVVVVSCKLRRSSIVRELFEVCFK